MAQTWGKLPAVAGWATATACLLVCPDLDVAVVDWPLVGSLFITTVSLGRPDLTAPFLSGNAQPVKPPAAIASTTVAIIMCCVLMMLNLPDFSFRSTGCL
jgi:hypothetical protein